MCICALSFAQMLRLNAGSYGDIFYIQNVWSKILSDIGACRGSVCSCYPFVEQPLCHALRIGEHCNQSSADSLHLRGDSNGAQIFGQGGRSFHNQCRNQLILQRLRQGP